MLGSVHQALLPLSAVQYSLLVERTAFGFRVLSYIIISPLIILGILDIVAYVIARTLQAFEHHPHVKFRESKVGILASKKEALPFKKSEDPTIERRHANPAIQFEQVAEETTDGPGSGDGGNSASKDSSGGGGRGATKYLSRPNSRPSCTPYAANEELSGVGLFSPAPTRPTTPTPHRESKNSNPTSTLGSSFLMTSATRLEE